MFFEFLFNFYIGSIHENIQNYDSNALYINISNHTLESTYVLSYNKDSLPLIFNAYLMSKPIFILYDSPARLKNFLKEFIRIYAKGNTYEDKLAAIIDLNLGV